MANEVSIINSVTKKERSGIYVYYFPLSVIEADPVADSMTIITADRAQNRVVAFADITDPLGAGDIEGYVDALAAGGYYAIPGGAGATETTVQGISDMIAVFEADGIPLRPSNSLPFSVTDRATSSIVGAAAGSNRLTHLFRVKPGSGTVAIPNFLFSFQSITNDDFAIEVSLSPALSAAVTDAMFADVHAASKLQILRPGINGAPAGLTITGYDPLVNGRLLLSKYGRQSEVVDSSLLTRAVIPDNTAVTYAISVVAMSAGMDLRGIVNWSEA